MRAAILLTASVAAFFLVIASTLSVVDHLIVDLDAGACPAGCWAPTTIGLFIDVLILVGVLSLSIMTPLAVIQTARQHAWAAAVAFLLLIVLSVWGALAIATSNTLTNVLEQGPQSPLYEPLFLLPEEWPQLVVPPLLVALTPLPGLVLSLIPPQRAAATRTKVLALVALASLILAGASLGYFEIGARQLSESAAIVGATPHLLEAVALFLACWLLGNITLTLSLLRRDRAPAHSLERVPAVE